MAHSAFSAPGADGLFTALDLFAAAADGAGRGERTRHHGGDGSSSPRSDGRSLFAGLTVIPFLVAASNGLRSTCDCISGELKAGTLILLFLASLKLNTILVSKLVVHSLSYACAFLGTLPVLGLYGLMGGVSGLMFAKGALAILAAAWLSLMVGLEQFCRNQGEHDGFSHGLRK